MSVGERINELPRELQGRAKSAALAAHEHPLMFAIDDVWVRLAERPDVDERGMLRVTVAEATVGGKAVTLDNPYLFHNPPLADETGTENLPKAFQQIVADAMRWAGR